jgi:hypothetical protein
MWRNINLPQKTIKIKGENNYKINSGGNDKEGFTLLLIISAGGKFLKPILVAKGKTKRSLNKFSLNNKIIGTYSNNGWVNNGIMKVALQQIYKTTKGKKSFLLLDQFSAHVSDFIINEAKNYNIHLIFIPKGKTDIFQPLDYSINGILKEKAKKLWRRERINNRNKLIKVSDGVKHFLTVKKEISKQTIINSFKHSCFNKKYIKNDV